MAKKTPLRRCVGCGEQIAKKDMLRIVKLNTGEVKIDPTGKENGRGAYIHVSKECFDKAVKSKGLERSFKISIKPEIYERLGEELIDIDSE